MTARASSSSPAPAAPVGTTGGTELGVRLEQEEQAGRQRALRALLQRPLLSADGRRANAFGLVRRHAPWLREWFARYPDWSLFVDSEHARLRKIPALVDDGSRPALDRKTGSPFSRRRYVLLCLALASLERSDRQTTLGNLAKSVVGWIAADPRLAAAGIAVDLKSQDERRDLVQVIRFLLDARVLVRLHGEEQQYLTGAGDVLYNVQRPALSAMLCVRRGPSTIDSATHAERVRALQEQPVPETDELRRRRIRAQLYRRLLDDPVVYYDALDEEERAYLQTQRPHIVRVIEDATGLIAEVRREGIAFVDPLGDLTDVKLPEEGTDGHLTLLIAERLAEHARREPGGVIGFATLRQHTAALIEQHKSHWRRDVTEPGAEVPLTEQTLLRLEALSLLQRTPDGVVPLPAVARYSLRGIAADVAEPAAPVKPSTLF